MRIAKPDRRRRATDHVVLPLCSQGPNPACAPKWNLELHPGECVKLDACPDQRLLPEARLNPDEPQLWTRAVEGLRLDSRTCFHGSYVGSKDLICLGLRDYLHIAGTFSCNTESDSTHFLQRQFRAQGRLANRLAVHSFRR